MKNLKSILYTAFILLLCAEIIYAQDFKIAPNTPHPVGNDFHDACIAASDTNGFLVTWSSTYKISSTIYRDNYVCRISNTGEILDSTAINIGGNPVWGHYCTSAVFAGGNWIIASQQDYMYEWVGVVRLTPSGVVLDTIPVNICWSNGLATILYPTIATNGQEILCVTGIAGAGLYGSIFDSDLNILVDKFLILADADASTAYRVSANGNNFFITWLNWDTADYNMKLAIVNPAGEILSIQTVNEEGNLKGFKGAPTITTLNDTTYITYFNALSYFDDSVLWIRRYSADGSPIDSSSVIIIESPDFELIIDDMSAWFQVLGYPDLVWVNEYFRFFWPGVSDPGISMWSFKPDLSTDNNQPVLLNSQCQIQFHYGPLGYDDSRSIIRASSIGGAVLTAWIDGREENPRVYGNFNDAAIPVELASFTATLNESNVTLNWQTATETNNSGFEIERKQDNNTWFTIGFKEGHGTTTEIQNYQFIDDISSITVNSLTYRLKQIDYDGSYEYSDEVLVDNPAPVDYALQQNYPNPFNPVTTISYSLPIKSQVDLVIYSTLGEKVIQLVSEEKEAGRYEFEFNAKNLPSSIYFYRLQAGDFIETKKMVLLR